MVPESQGVLKKQKDGGVKGNTGTWKKTQCPKPELLEQHHQ